MHQRAAVGEGHEQDRDPQQPEPARAQRLGEGQAGQTGIGGGTQLGRALLGLRFAEPQETDRQGDQERQERKACIGGAPALPIEQGHGDHGQQHRGHAGTQQGEAQREAAVAVEPDVDGARPGDRGRTDTDQADQHPDEVVPGERPRDQREGREHEPEGRERAEGHGSHAVTVGHPPEHRRKQCREEAVDRDAEADLGTAPAELRLQRVDEEADGVERQR